MRELALKLRRRWVSRCGWLWRSSHIYIFTGVVSCGTNMERPRAASSRAARRSRWPRRVSWQRPRRVAVAADRTLLTPNQGCGRGGCLAHCSRRGAGEDAAEWAQVKARATGPKGAQDCQQAI